MSRIIGIDLGTTFSVAAAIINGRPEIIPNIEGGRLTPSVVAVTSNGRYLVGQLARSQAVVNPERTISSIKRKMGSNEKIKIEGREYTPQEISSLILQKVKSDVETYLGERIKKAVITVPAYFNDNQRQATKDAGVIAGLEVVRIINEPTAASLAYGLDKENVHTILVWDLGGGTFDVSILELDKGVFEVKAVGGNTHLGGDDWDERIVKYLIDEFERDHEINLREDKIAMQRIKEAAEKAKIDLSSALRTNIRIPIITRDRYGPKHLETILTRAKFEELTSDLLQKMVEPTKQALPDAGLSPSQIDRVVLVGGATRMPAVQELAKNMMGKEPYREINPDEAVALGAAIQAGILEGIVKGKILIDVTPLSLGIETQGGLFAKIIERNTTIPTSKGQIFTTARDNQPEVDIHILQGERELACNNISLGDFKLEGIPLARRGEPQIEVAFDIDVNGIVHVSAKDLHTEDEKKIQISSLTKLTEVEIRRMIKEAQKNAKRDKKRKDQIQLGIQAEGMIYAAKMVIDDNKEILDEEDLDSIEEAIFNLRSSMAKDKINTVRAKIEDLKKLVEAAHNEASAKRRGLLPAKGARN